MPNERHWRTQAALVFGWGHWALDVAAVDSAMVVPSLVARANGGEMRREEKRHHHRFSTKNPTCWRSRMLSVELISTTAKHFSRSVHATPTIDSVVMAKIIASI